MPTPSPKGCASRATTRDVYAWNLRGDEVHDVYVRGYPTLTDAADVARRLEQGGWTPELTRLPSRS